MATSLSLTQSHSISFTVTLTQHGLIVQEYRQPSCSDGGRNVIRGGAGCSPPSTFTGAQAPLCRGKTSGALKPLHSSRVDRSRNRLVEVVDVAYRLCCLAYNHNRPM